MGVSIRFSDASDGDDGPFQLASASGWAAFAEWVDGLPSEDKHYLKRLTKHGSVENTASLSEELDSALRKHPPFSSDVKDIIEGLQELLGIGDKNEVAIVEM